MSFRDEWAAFLLAVQFLTRLPVPDPGYTPERMAASPRWHPAAGAVIGALTGAVFWVSAALWPHLVASTVATAFGLLLTGCFHEDGFADACDGLGGGSTRERALEIMRDSRLGTYGTAGLAMMLLGRIACFAALPVAAVPWVLVGMHAASRLSSVIVLATSAYVRDHGTGKPVSEGMRPGDLALPAATAALALVPALAAMGSGAVLAGLAGLAAGHVLMRARFERRLGGYTGDCLGAVEQCSGIGFLLGILAWG
ncbi:MAG: adenosylcobinamide-GDP ribazoletransferase [Paracoccaceae bacterium]